MLELFNEDCMEGMKRYPDKYFDLAIVDPPYGINELKSGGIGGSNRKHIGKKYPNVNWDMVFKKPNDKYFNKLFLLSENQIIWGANYFHLPVSSHWVVWDKLTTGNFADCELAWTSFEKSIVKYTYRWNGFQQGEFYNTIENRIHPTQKPVKLYEWLLKNYAKPGDKILDTHLGSGSIAIACYNLDFDLVGFEIDKEYYDAAVKRLDEHKKQQRLFDSAGSYAR